MWWPPPSDGVEGQLLSANLAREAQRWRTWMIAFMLQVGRAVLRPHLCWLLGLSVLEK